VLAEMGLNFKKAEMVRDRGDPKRKWLAEKSGVPTVPVIEIDGKFIGDSAKIIEHLHAMGR
jgi:glutathione S-transferase